MPQQPPVRRSCNTTPTHALRSPRPTESDHRQRLAAAQQSAQRRLQLNVAYNPNMLGVRGTRDRAHHPALESPQHRPRAAADDASARPHTIRACLLHTQRRGQRAATDWWQQNFAATMGNARGQVLVVNAASLQVNSRGEARDAGITRAAPRGGMRPRVEGGVRVPSCHKLAVLAYAASTACLCGTDRLSLSPATDWW